VDKYRSDPDDELIRRFVSGDIKAFETIVLKYQKPIINFIYRMTGNFQEAEDVAQEVFMKLYRSAYTYKGRSSFTTWLFRIASNLCCDSLRSSSHWDRVPIEKIRDGLQGKLLSPQELMESSELIQFIETAIGRLPNQQRQAIVLREYYGFSYTSIAEVADCSVTATKSRIHKAKQKLKKELSFILD
jgi:RNA polymerase sigma-70 factor (ECF subfamily)